MSSTATQRKPRPHYEGKPTLAQVMRTPKWIGALLIALAVAGGFAWLGQWQLSHAITLENDQDVDSEIVRSLFEETEPGGIVSDHTAGTVLEANGSFVLGDFDVVEQRTNQGVQGAWVVGHLVTDETPSGHLAVAIGWAPDTDSAEQALHQIEEDLAGVGIDLEGRYMPGDAAVGLEETGDPSRLLSMVPAQLVNIWQPFEGRAYAGFIVMHPADPLNEQSLAQYGLDVIDSVPPLPVETVNWLNVFYAAEWVVFGGFALFFWYRLVRDDWERIHELKLLEQEKIKLAEE